MKKLALSLAILPLLATGCADKAPSREAVKAAIAKLTPVNFEVLDVSPMPQVKSLYQVVVKLDRQPLVFYVDKDAKYAFSGSIVEIATKRNLTIEAQNKYLPK